MKTLEKLYIKDAVYNDIPDKLYIYVVAGDIFNVTYLLMLVWIVGHSSSNGRYVIYC